MFFYQGVAECLRLAKLMEYPRILYSCVSPDTKNVHEQGGVLLACDSTIGGAVWVLVARLTRCMARANIY